MQPGQRIRHDNRCGTVVTVDANGQAHVILDDGSTAVLPVKDLLTEDA